MWEGAAPWGNWEVSAECAPGDVAGDAWDGGWPGDCICEGCMGHIPAAPGGYICEAGYASDSGACAPGAWGDVAGEQAVWGWEGCSGGRALPGVVRALC